jgi:two-component sensor histidine kinase
MPDRETKEQTSRKPDAGGTSSMSRLIEHLPLLADRPGLRYASTLVFCVLLLLLRLALHPVFPPGYPFVTFFPAVIVVAFLFGPRTGVFAGVLCGVFAWYYLIAPDHSFRLDGPILVALGFYTGVVAVDVTLVHWMQTANAQLRLAREQGRRLAEESERHAERAELLFQELQHRVGNNLQMIGAVLSLQLRGLEEPTARRAITDAVSRLQVIGRIQRQLYRKNGELLPLDTFVAEVCEQFMRSNGRPGIACKVVAQTGLVLPPDAAVPMALVLSEAIANALEHGFADREHGRVDVVLDQQGDRLDLQVRDDGRGLPPGFDPAKSESLGLRISRVLCQQLNADYTLEPSSTGCTMRMQLSAQRFLVAD